MGDVTYRTAAGKHYSYGPSPSIWGDLNEDELKGFPFDYGYEIRDDFTKYQATATTVVNASGYPFLDSNCTITGVAAKGGGLQLFTTDDNAECSLQAGGVNSAPFIISDTAADAKKLWFECAIKRSNITDAKGGFFVGLVGENSAAANFIADGGADFADVDLIGFWNDETDDSTGAHVHFVYQITGKGFVTKIDTVATLVADTYTRLGFKYDPNEVAAKKIKVFVDGVEQSTYVTATNIATDTFPDGEEMSPMVALKAAHDDDFTVTMKWWRCVQLH